MKTCRRCGDSFDESAFNRNKSAPDGLQSQCRACQSAVNRDWRQSNPDLALGQKRRWRHRLGPVRRARLRREWQLGNREKEIAHQAVARALRRGDLVRPEACSQCGRTGRIQGHHADYARQLDVEWLCPRCHGIRHYDLQREAQP